MRNLVCVEDKVSKSEEIKGKNVGDPIIADAVRYEKATLCMNELASLVSIEEEVKFIRSAY